MKNLMKHIVAALLLAASISGADAACWQWSLTANANATADPTINYSEGMSPSSVNDSARAAMARLAECRDDLSGKLTSTGTSTAYAVTSNQSLSTAIPSPPTNGQAITFKPVATNGAAVTLAVDGGTAYPIQSAPGTAVAAGALVQGVPYGVTFSTANSSWLLRDFYAITVDLDQFGSTRGSILERASGGWTAVVPGAAGTVWTSNGTGADPTYQAATIVPPQGYLTPVSGTPVITSNSLSATTIYYTPKEGTSVPIYNGSIFVNTTFAELTLSLSTSQAANQIYDVCIFSDSGTVRAGFTPAWTAATAGASSRGTGAGTPQLTRLNGLLVNAVSMTVNNGASTYSVAANRCTYVGSMMADASAGQVTNHVTAGQSRKRGLWNAYNRVPIAVQISDPTSSWADSTGVVWHFARNDTSNTMAVFTGLAEEWVSLTYDHLVVDVTTTRVGIGINSSTATTGFYVGGSQTDTSQIKHAAYEMPPSLGLNNVNALNFLTSGTNTFYGTVNNMILSARYRG